MRLSYVMLLFGLWLASMAELVLGLHGFIFGGAGAGLSGWFIAGGAQIAAFASVSLAEEAAAWMAPRAEEFSLQIGSLVAPELPKAASLPLTN